MTLLLTAWHYAIAHGDQVMLALRQHVALVALPLAIAIGVGIPLGWLSARQPIAAAVLLNSFNTLRVIPSLAVLFLLVPYLGLTYQTAATALTLLTLPPILTQTDVAIRTLDPHVRESAFAMGMSSWQVFWQIDLPLAAPLLVAGIKTATVEAIASATLAAFIGAGGLGNFITLGFAVYDPAILLVGAVPVAVLAIAAEVSLGFLERHL